MGGYVEGGVGIADKISPRRVEIEKSRAELRKKCEIRDKTKRELEFLLEGGNPLELESGNTASVSVQSTSFTEQLADELGTSEAKGSFAFTASPHGDSVGSSGRLGTNPCEPNSADNLMLFDAERELSEWNRSSHPSRSNIVSSEKLPHTGGYHRIGERGDSAVFDLPRKAYKRRYRSRPYHDRTLPSSADVNLTHGRHGSSLSCHDPKDVKGLISDVENPIMLSNSNSKPTSAVDDTLHKTGLTGKQQDSELDGIKGVEPSKDLAEGCPLNSASDAIGCEIPFRDQHNQKSPSDVLGTIQRDSNGLETIPAMEGVAFADIECQPGVAGNKIENKTSTLKMNGFSSRNSGGTKNDSHNYASCSMMGSDSGSSFTSQSIDGTNDANTTNKIITESNGQIKDQNSIPNKILVLGGDESVKEKQQSGIGNFTPGTVESSVVYQTELEDGLKLRTEEELNGNGSALKNEEKDQTVNEDMRDCKLTEPDSGRKFVDQTGLNNKTYCSLRHQDSTDISIPDLSEGGSSMLASVPKMTRVIDEDSILKEAKIIEAKRKRIAELSVANSSKKIFFKSHWGYVLEEMAWLANDFAQERILKIAIAAQISSRAAFNCHMRKHKNSFHLETKQIAHSLAKFVMEFWQLVDEKNKVLDQQGQGEDIHSLQAYALRFKQYENSNVVYNRAEMPLAPDELSDMGILDTSWKENLIEENLFYTVLPGTMENYRNSVESHVTQFQRIAGGVIENVETSAWDAVAGCDSLDNAKGEKGTNTYDMSLAFEDGKISGFIQKKQKHLIHAYGPRPYEVSSDISHMLAAENKVVHQSASLPKRPGGNIKLSIPTKRVRTASRKVVSPFSVGTSRFLQANKTDASSGDTNSYQDDQSALQGDSHAPYNVEVESVVKFENQLAFVSNEVLMKHRKKNKKKKAKHMNAAYESRWQLDSTFQNEQFQRDHLRKSHQHEFNCSSGLLGQPMAKKQKTMHQSQDNTSENITPIGGSVPSPVASQMSNMSNTNKFIKILGGRDRVRKQKLLKMSSGQPGSGSPWMLSEDQALVVLVHDLGPNWELVSDAINSTFQFKFIFRKAKECKERHNFLMYRTSGDGADSAEDSGSSQLYPSTLPGIPKGSARQLFQRLQGPMEEDTLKSHFEKIILIGQKRHYRKTQNDNQDPKLLQQPHSSHAIALSQVCPNNLNGGPILTPLDLCDSIAGNDMLPLGYQGSHSGGLSISNQGIVTPMHSASSPTSSLQGSPSMIVGSNFASSSSTLNSSVRDTRNRPPRHTTSPADEQQRMQQYNQMMSGRGVPPPNNSAPRALPGDEHGGLMLPGGSGMGLVSGVNRGMPSANVKSGVVSSQGSLMLRPREASHMMRPGLGQDAQRPMMPADLQKQGPHGNSQMPHHFSALSSSFPNQTISPPVPSYPLHHPISPKQPQVLSTRHHPHFLGPTANHTPSVQQQAYALRLAKERQHQNRFLQQPQINTSNTVGPHNIHPQPQIPFQNNHQVQVGSPIVSLSSMNSMKQQTPPQVAVRNVPVGVTNQTSKQRQRHQHNQSSHSNRPHPQQKQQTQPPKPTIDNKMAKGVGRGNPLAHPNVPIDSPLINGVSTSPSQFMPPQKHNLGQGARSAKNLHPVAFLTHKSDLGHVTVAGSNHQQTLSHQKSVTNNQLPNQRVVQPQTKGVQPQTKGPSSDQHLTISSTEMDKGMTLSQDAESASAAQWHALEPVDQTTLNSTKNTSSVGPVLSNVAAQNSQQREFLQSRKGKFGGGPVNVDWNKM